MLPHWSEQRSERDLQRALRCRIQQRERATQRTLLRVQPEWQRSRCASGLSGSVQPAGLGVGRVSLPGAIGPGLEADIAANVIRVRPALPEFLNEVTIQRMTVLGKCGSLNVRRDASGYHVESDGLPLDVAERSGSR